MNQYSILLIFIIHFISLNSFAQMQFAVADFEEIHEFVEKKIVGDHVIHKKVESLYDSLKIEVFDFINDEFQWAQTRIDGGCLSLKEVQLTENYINYLNKEIVLIEQAILDLNNSYNENLTLFSKELSTNLFKKSSRLKNVNVVLESSKILYQSNSNSEITKELVSEIINFKSQIDLEKLYVGIIPVIQDIENSVDKFCSMTFSKYKKENPLEENQSTDRER